ncbi:MAG TPA: YggS family pyridoxal phosphate-dependent enzyme [Bacteroidia bacterium]|nr:YggS family pyridoxal phosphate-dependent enzyme [Bacteroidia bacterium]
METLENTISQNLLQIKKQIPSHITLIAVSKFQPIEKILQAYNAGHRDFGENYAQELKQKYEQLPKDIRWHFIGHLQSNKVKYIASFVYLIHSIDNLKLLYEVNKQAIKNNRVINCLLQIHIAKEETKFGFDIDECRQVLKSSEIQQFQNVKILGLMGMATFTNDSQQIKNEFLQLKNLFDEIKQTISLPNVDMKILSMGMSNDYPIAIECGSNAIRIGTLIFGERKKTN